MLASVPCTVYLILWTLCLYPMNRWPASYDLLASILCQPWYNPQWLTGLKTPNNQLTNLYPMLASFQWTVYLILWTVYLCPMNCWPVSYELYASIPCMPLFHELFASNYTLFASSILWTVGLHAMNCLPRSYACLCSLNCFPHPINILPLFYKQIASILWTVCLSYALATTRTAKRKLQLAVGRPRESCWHHSDLVP